MEQARKIPAWGKVRTVHVAPARTLTRVSTGWDIITKITREPVGTFAVNIQIACACGRHSDTKALPAFQGFATACGAAAFILSWTSEWMVLNGDA
jgi:hypothetical protein